jgi:hypothetical protein
MNPEEQWINYLAFIELRSHPLFSETPSNPYLRDD